MRGHGLLVSGLSLCVIALNTFTVMQFPGLSLASKKVRRKQKVIGAEWPVVRFVSAQLTAELL